MTVQELFREVDFYKIGKHLANNYFRFNINKEKTEKEKDALRTVYAQRVYDCAQEMLALHAIENSDKVVKCVWTRDFVYMKELDTGNHGYYISVSMHYISDLSNLNKSTSTSKRSESRR